MTDRHAVIWTRVSGQPLKMASLVATARECRIVYTKDFIDSGLPGLSLMADPVAIGQDALVWKSTESRPLHPRLMAMIPPNQAGNLQRRIYAEILARRPAPPAPGMETEWEMLMLSGHNGIGHVDVFPDDILASDWYSRTRVQPAAAIQNSRSAIWRILRDDVRQHSSETEGLLGLADILGPTPSAGGMISKVLLSIPDRETWAGEFMPFGVRPEGERFVDAIVKIEEPQYDGLLDLESLCLDVHRTAGFDVPRSWRLDIDGLRLLAIERFDRDHDGLPIPFESLMTVFSSGSRRIQRTSDVTWPEVGVMVGKISRLCNLDIRRAQETLFRRLAFSLMTGNGDMHLDNIALLGDRNTVRLAPVYDPAPMRAWPRHNMRMAIPIEFELGASIYAQIAETATSFGLSVDQGLDILRDAANATSGFCDRVTALENVPAERRASLVSIIRKEREMLEALTPTPASSV